MRRIGLLGAGRMGSHHARTLASGSRCTLAWVADPDAERAATLAARWGVPVGPGPADAVIVATPARTHAAVARPWLDQGVPCLIEKPLDGALDAAESLDHPLVSVGLCERFNPALRALRGHPLAASDWTVERLSPPPDRPIDVDVGLDLAIHDLDLLLTLLGPLAVRSAAGDADHWEVALAGPGGRAALTVSRRATARRRTLRGGPWLLDLASGTASLEGRPVQLPREDALSAQREAWLDALDGRASPVAGPKDALAAQRLAEQIRERLGGR